MPIITSGKLAGAQGAAILNFPKVRKPTISFLEISPQRLILQKNQQKEHKISYRNRPPLFFLASSFGRKINVFFKI